MEEILQAISNYGFPVVCCIVLFKQNDKLTKTLSKIQTSLALMANEIADLKQQKGAEDGKKKE